MEKSSVVATVRNILTCFLLIFLGSCNSLPETGVVVTMQGDTLAELPADTIIVVPIRPVTVDTVVIRDTVIAFRRCELSEIYLSQVGVREATGRNDGPQIRMYLRSVGLGEGYAYCSAFVHWSLDSAGIPNTVTAWSPSAHNAKNIVWTGKKFLKDPEPGDVGCLYYASLKRIGHTFFYHRQINSSVYESVEANTNVAGSREGDGVYKKKRSYNATYSITRWK